MAQVSLHHVTKEFENGVIAVSDLTLTIRDKEFLVLVGPSGCGKSTTLRMIAGLEEVTKGDIYIDDARVNDVPPKDRNIAMVFQNYALYPHMSVFRNMSFGLRARRIPRAQARTRVMEAAVMLELGDLLKRKPAELSGGQRQRVAVGRAIVRKPSVFLFDEPLSSLDAALRTLVREEMAELHDELKATMIYVTHDQIEAVTLGNRIVVMRSGRLEQVGTPSEVYTKPANKFVAGFIGNPPMNFIPGTVLEKEGSYQVEAGSLAIRFPGDQAEMLKNKTGQAVILGIRPEHLDVRRKVRTEPPFGAVSAKVEAVEPLGRGFLLYLSAADLSLVCLADLHCGVAEDDDVDVVFRHEKLQLFDPETEESLIWPLATQEEKRAQQ